MLQQEQQIIHCKYCGIMYVQTEDKLEHCSEFCWKADNGELIDDDEK